MRSPCIQPKITVKQNKTTKTINRKVYEIQQVVAVKLNLHNGSVLVYVDVCMCLGIIKYVLSVLVVLVFFHFPFRKCEFISV